MINAQFPPVGGGTLSTIPVQIVGMPTRNRGRPPKPLRAYPNRIRALREKRGLSLEHLAAEIGISDETLRRYETGERQVKVSDLEHIARALDVPAPQLLSSVDPELDKQERALLALFRAASPQDRERLLSAAPAILGIMPQRKVAF